MDNQLQPNTTSITLARVLPQLLVVVLVVLFFPSFTGLSHEWTQWDQSLAHAYPLLLCFLFLLYRASPLAAIKQSWWVNWLLALILIAGSLLWFLFHVIQIKILEQLIIVPILYCMIAFVFGVKTLWQLRFLLIMPLFVLPIWDYLTDPLVQLASTVVGEMVRIIRIPALIDGSSIFIPSGHIMIADGCSGLRYLIISLALGYTISYLNGYKEKGLILSLLIAAILGLVANWLRIFILILVGYYSEMQSSLMQDHETFGWILFAVICFPAIYFAPVVKHTSSNQLGAAIDLPVKKLLLLFPLLLPGSLVAYAVSFDKAPVDHQYTINSTIWQQTLATAPLSLSLPKAQKQLRYSSNEKIYLQLDLYQPANSRQRLVPYIPRQYDSEYWVLEKNDVVTYHKKEIRSAILRQKTVPEKLRKCNGLTWVGATLQASQKRNYCKFQHSFPGINILQFLPYSFPVRAATVSQSYKN